MSKKFIGIILGLPILFLGIWGVILSFQINSGIEVRLPIMGYDPRDLLSGHYILYQIDWESADCKQFENAIDTAFIKKEKKVKTKCENKNKV